MEQNKSSTNKKMTNTTNTQEQRRNTNLVEKLVDNFATYAGPIVGTAISTGAFSYGATPSNWTAFNPAPAIGFIAGTAGLIGSLIWLKEAHEEKTEKDT